MDRRADYRFVLPPERIAQAPADRRSESRLLVVDEDLRDCGFAELPQRLPPRSVVVVNDTRVIPARVHARKSTGGSVELLFLEPMDGFGERVWRCMVRGSKKLRSGVLLTCGEDPLRVLELCDDGTALVEVEDPLAFLARHGQMPLPPYIERQDGVTEADVERYQTVFARHPGAVAAPTAGLHFTPALIAALEAAGHTLAAITLHVGAGTFLPMRAEQLADHRMHAERFHIDPEVAELVSGERPVIAVGTTVVRTLESAATSEGRLVPGSGVTDLFIRPGYQFRVVDRMITNFHLPESTLLVLVCAFGGYERLMAAYRHAIAGDYRFYSYGDAMLLAPGDR